MELQLKGSNPYILFLILLLLILSEDALNTIKKILGLSQETEKPV